MGLSRSSLSAAAAAWRAPLRPIMAAPQATTPSSRSGTNTGLPEPVLHHKGPCLLRPGSYHRSA